ncbi:MAG: hypothetical protein QXN95_00250 [Candidatus Bathyarchaeia archaeon]
MSEMENPVDTVVRLLGKNMRVVKEDGSLAKIAVSREWLDRELFKNVDGQITVGLAESRDSKVEISGRIRRRIANLRVNVWAIDKPNVVDSGRLMRQKIVEEVNRIVHQNRNRPNITEYDYVGLGYPEGDPHKAFHGGASSEPSPAAAGWIELTADDYSKIWYSDDQRYSKSTGVNGEYALMLFRFKIESKEKTVKKIVLAFEGYGTASGGNGVTIKVWNHAAQQWQNAQSGTDETDETLTITLTENIANYIDDNGYCWLLARTTNPSNGSTAAVIYCDFCNCTVTVNGITYLDVVSFRDADRVDVKPFIYRTEFTLKSWFFEDVGGIF